MASITSYFKFEQELKFFEGWVSGVTVVTKDNGSYFCKFSIPLTQNKDDEPLWLNCNIYDMALCDRFTKECRKGSRVLVGGVFTTSTAADGTEYINFNVKTYEFYGQARKREAVG